MSCSPVISSFFRVRLMLCPKGQKLSAPPEAGDVDESSRAIQLARITKPISLVEGSSVKIPHHWVWSQESDGKSPFGLDRLRRKLSAKLVTGMAVIVGIADIAVVLARSSN
jgi:hypothetical protein